MGKIALNTIKTNTRSNSEPLEYLICFSAKTQEALYKYIVLFSAWLKGEDGQNSNIGDIAYTLLARRSKFNYRYAFRVKSKDELTIRIETVIRNGGFGESEVGNAIHYKKNADNTATAEPLEKLFITGAVYDWDRLYDNLGFKCIPLPSYAFSNEKYWAQASQNKVDLVNKSLSATIDANCSTIDEVRYCKTFNGNEFYIKDHVVGIDRILPGAAYLDIAVSAGKLAKPGAGISKIENIIWADPIIIPKNSRNVKVFIGLYPQPQGADLEVYSETDAQNRIIHSQGRLYYTDLNKNSKRELLDLHGIQQRCAEKISGFDCYANFQARGLNLGESFHTIEYLCYGENEGLSHLILPEKLNESFNDYQMNPVMVDGALETVIGLVEKMKIGSLSLPCGIDSVQIYGNLEKNCFSYALPSQNTEKDVKKFDVFLANEKGEILLKMLGFSLKSMQALQNNKWTNFLTPKWEPFIPTCSSSAQLFGKTLAFSMDETIFDSAIFEPAGIGDKKPGIIFVKPGESFRKLKENVFTVKTEDDYQLLFNLLAQENWVPENIVHACSFENKSNHDINTQLEPLYSLFYIIKSIARTSNYKNISFLYIYESSGETANPYYAAMSAFLKTAALELSGLKYRTLGVTSLDDGKKLAINISDVMNHEETAGKDLRLLQNRLYIRKLQEIESAGISDGCNLIKENGVYLITGGCGGLGRIISAYIAKNYHAQLVLVGHSELDPLKESLLQSLKSMGGDAIYINCDVSAVKNLCSVVKEAKEKFGKINGVIHCAGTTNDALLVKKTQTEIQKVLMPKVNGLINLDEATSNEKLDFFVMFSSIAALLGNVGQCDYAYANSFMDYFAIVRNDLIAKGLRTGKTVSINWTLWENGGMCVEDETRRLFSNTFGVDFLSDETGLDVFLKSLSNKNENILFVSGDKKKVKKMLSINTINRNQNTSTIILPKDILLAKIQKIVGNMVSEILKVKQSDIVLEKDMNEYGFNSITFTKLTNRINEKFHTDITPAILFEHSTLGSFATYLYEEYGQQFAEGNDNSDLAETEGLSGNDETPQKTVTVNTLRSLNPKIMGKAVGYGDGTFLQYKKDNDVAIIGMFGIMPDSDNLAEFWNNLLIGKDMVTEIPKSRWDFKKYSSGDSMISRWGSFMKEVDKFDAKFFGVSPREAELMDPQQRILMEVVWKTIEDAGYNPYDLSGSKTGLFVGHSTMDYSQLLMNQGTEIEAYSSTGSARCILVNRISYFLNFHGPSEPVDTACSSSLIAIHRAAQSILNGECSMAIAGGINVMLNPTLHISFSKAGMLSPDGRCKTFDKSANGYVRGEGVGTILLKPLKQAQADGDYIYAVIKGSAVNHGGKVNSLTAPNPNAQAEVIISAMEKAAVDPCTITYIEAHGTGTKIGDPVEINGLKKAYLELFRRNNKPFPENPYCGLGTVKTSIGHLEAAAGIASTIKTLLSMKYGILPQNINLKEANPYIDIKGTPFYLIDKQREWVRLSDDAGREIPRRAGISGFGFGGANAHIVLEEYRNISEEDKGNEHVITLSANSEQGVNHYAKELLLYITDLNRVNNESERIAATDVKIGANLLEVILKNALGAALDVSPAELNANDLFREIGLDDVAAAKFIHSVNENFKLDIPAPLLAEVNTLHELADYIFSEHYETVSGMLGSTRITAHWESSSSYKPVIADIAYTLSTGRAPMPYRVAMIANNMEDLEQKLKEFCNGNTSVQNVYCGRINDAKSSSRLLLPEGIEGSQFIENLIKNRNLPKLCELWAAGAQIDWKQICGSDGKRHRVPLPTYPFERKRYWFEDKPQNSKPNAVLNQSPAPMQKRLAPQHMDLDSTGELDYSVGDDYNGDEVELKIIDGKIAVVIMKDEEHRNTFSNNLVFGLIQTFGKLRTSNDIKAIIVTGYDHVFCMGGTQEQLTAISEKKNKFSDMPFMYRGLLEAKVPVIAAMQGHASGGGMLFGLYADIVIMAEESVYSAVFTKYGFTPGMGATLILGEKLGANLATEMMFTAKSYTGEELQRRGATVLFKKRAEVLAEAVSIARMLAGKPLNTLTVLKKELSGRILRKLPEIIRIETEMHDRTFSDPETQKRIEKFYNSAGASKQEVSKTATLSNKVQNNNSERLLMSLKPREEYSKLQKNSILKQPREAISLRDISACGSISCANVTTIHNGQVTPANEKSLDPSIGQRLQVGEPKCDTETVQDGLNIILSRILHIAAAEIDGYASFRDMGIDSVNGVEIVRDINKKYGLNIETVALYDHATSIALAAFVTEEIEKSHSTAGIGSISSIHVATELEDSGDAIASQDLIYEKSSEPFCDGNFTNAAVSNTGNTPENAGAEMENQFFLPDNNGQEEIQAEVNDILSRVLHISPAEIDGYSNFKDMGVDSVNGVEIMRDINKKYNLNLETVTLYDHSTTNELAAFVMGEIKSFRNAVSSSNIHIATELADVKEEKTQVSEDCDHAEYQSEKNNGDDLVSLLEKLQNGEADIQSIAARVGDY